MPSTAQRLLMIIDKLCGALSCAVGMLLPPQRPQLGQGIDYGVGLTHVC
jgi:hypothetical protein